MIDKDKIERSITQIIKAIGDDPKREGLVGTPKRIADMYSEIFDGSFQDPKEELQVGFEEGHHEMVIFKDIPFYSMCEHHLLPFAGMAHVSYIPKSGRIIGLSKIARVVEALSRQLQVQERLTKQIADLLDKHLKPLGVMVVIDL